MPENLLAPGAVLALWTLIMLIWAATTRFQAFGKAGIDLKAAPPGGRGVDLEGVLPPLTNWKSHNYTHLLEQPTLFYAVILFLHLPGGSTDLTARAGVGLCRAAYRAQPVAGDGEPGPGSLCHFRTIDSLLIRTGVAGGDRHIGLRGKTIWKAMQF